MSFDTWILYALTVLALLITPGASHLLMLSNSATYGARKSMATAVGDLSANTGQMFAAALGLGVLIVSSVVALTAIKWIGVAYLIWHAIRTIKNAKPIGIDNEKNQVKVSIRTLYLQGFITSAANPKAILFFAALFPQFITYDESFWIQFLILSSTYIIIDGAFLISYGFGAQWIVSLLKPNSTIWVNRGGGILMLVAAVLLGVKSLDEVG